MEIKRQLRATPSSCRICGASAIYSYFGAISCAPCKIFFKRNAKHGLTTLKCNFDYHCEININTRQLCSYCRLVKCFASGMQAELIRSSVAKKSRKKPSIHQDSKSFSIYNILQSDRSSLTSGQWSVISNLYHSYERDSGLLIAERYMYEQTLLPYKLRFKCSTMIEMMHRVFNSSSFFYKSNVDFLSLSSNDQTILLEDSFGYLASFSSNYIFHQIGLISQPTYYDAMSIMIHSDMIPIVKCLEYRLNIDIITVKLFLAILLFTIGHHSMSVHLNNIEQIRKIQDKYTELTWRYILSKYDFHRAVMIFSDFLRSILKIDEMLVHMSDMSWYRTTIDKLRQQIEQSLML